MQSHQLAAEGGTVLVSSHLMSEMALTADHLIIIGPGQLIADTPTARLIESSARRDVLRDQVAGRVTLAAFPSAAASFVPAAWAALARSAPQVRLDLLEMEPEESLPAVLRGETDVAVAHARQVFTVSRGGDRKPAVRVVLDALAA